MHVTHNHQDAIDAGEAIRIRHGASQKMGCHFYIAFMQVEGTIYHCSGINTMFATQIQQLGIVIHVIEIRNSEY